MLPMGFAVFDGFAVRVDILERIAAQLRARARGGAVFSLPPTLAAEAGLTRGELALLVEALGFRAQTGTEGTLIYGKPESRRRRDQTAKRPGGASAAASPFAALAALRLAPRA